VDARTVSDQVPRNQIDRYFRFFGAGSTAGLKNPGCSRGLGLVEFGFLSGRDRGRETGSIADLWFKTPKRRKAHESSGRGRPRFAAVRISAESKALKLRGIVTSWSSEQEHAMSETA
jgi:hypothetical protein